MKTLILLGLYTALLGVAMWHLYGWLNPPEVVERTKIEYKDRFIEKRDTVTVDRPVYRTIFKEQTDTVVVRVPVPVGFQAAGVISPTPVRIDGRDVTLTYWAPDSSRFIQDTYQVQRPRFGAWLDVGGERLPRGYLADARVNLRWKWFRIFGGYGVMDGHAGPVYGFRATIFGRE